MANHEVNVNEFARAYLKGEIARLQAALAEITPTKRGPGRPRKANQTPEAREAVSRRMKEMWARKRAERAQEQAITSNQSRRGRKRVSGTETEK